MKTRIRHFRKARSLTQGELARRLGTTSATVSRLETSDMTVSIDWLQRIAQALDVEVTDLLSADERQTWLGHVNGAGRIVENGEARLPQLAWRSVAKEPLLARIGTAQGAYRAGDLLIADRLERDDWQTAESRDVFATFEEGTVLGRLVLVASGPAVVPLNPGQAPFAGTPKEIARVVMLVRDI